MRRHRPRPSESQPRRHKGLERPGGVESWARPGPPSLEPSRACRTCKPATVRTRALRRAGPSPTWPVPGRFDQGQVDGRARLSLARAPGGGQRVRHGGGSAGRCRKALGGLRRPGGGPPRDQESSEGRAVVGSLLASQEAQSARWRPLAERGHALRCAMLSASPSAWQALPGGTRRRREPCAQAASTRCPAQHSGNPPAFSHQSSTARGRRCSSPHHSVGDSWQTAAKATNERGLSGPERVAASWAAGQEAPKIRVGVGSNWTIGLVEPGRNERDTFGALPTRPWSNAQTTSPGGPGSRPGVGFPCRYHRGPAHCKLYLTVHGLER